jgi:hypothetical protein
MLEASALVDADPPVLSAVRNLCELLASDPDGMPLRLHRRRGARDAIRNFTRAFWSWWTECPKAELEQLPRPAPRPFRGAGALANLPVLFFPTSKPLDGLRRALVAPDLYEKRPDSVPQFRDESGLVYSYGGPAGEKLTPEAAIAMVREVAKLAPQNYIVWVACMAKWLAELRGPKQTALGSVRIHVNEILELMGKKRHHKGGFREAQKREVSTRLAKLNELWINGTYWPSGNGKKLVIRGRSMEVSYVDEIDLLGNAVPYEFLVRPSEAIAPLLLGEDAQIGTFFPSLAKLDASQGVGRMASLIGFYLAVQYRIRSASGNFNQPFKVQTLLNGACVEIEADARHYVRFREHFESALDELKNIGVIAPDGWEYAKGDEDRLPDRGWFRPWLENRVVIKPPAAIVTRRSRERRSIAAPVIEAPATATTSQRQKKSAGAAAPAAGERAH